MDILDRIRTQGFTNSLLVAVNVILFAACTIQELLTGDDLIFACGVMYPPAVLDGGQWYRLVTSMFLHVDAMHLANNMIMLAALGLYVERSLGAIRFLMLYMVSGVCGNLLSMFLDVRSGEYVLSAGASGAVFGVVGALLEAAIKNRGKIYGLSMKRIMLMIALSLFAGLTSSGVNNAAHFGGCIAGFLLGLIL